MREVKQQSSPYELSIEPDLATHRGNAPDLSSISYRAQFARKIFRRRLLPDNDFFLLTIFFNFFFSPLSSSSRSIDFVNSLDERNSMIRRSLSLMQRSSKSVKRYRSIIYIYIYMCVRSYARFPELIPSFVFTLGTRNYEMRSLNACKRYLHY